MTYCAGWKYKNAVFLIADSAATKPIRPSTTHSSLGQLHAEVRGEHVEEALLKLVPLGTGVVAAFAGDVSLATTCLDFLRDNLRSTSDVRSLLRTMTVSLGPFSSDRPVGLLVAMTTEDGHSELLHWDTVQGVNPNAFDHCQIGSLTSYHTALTPAFLSQLAAGNLDTDRMLPVVTAIVQSYGVHDDLIPMNVGGLIFGIQTKLGAVCWLQDMNVVLYDPSFAFKEIISAIARDNTIVVSSSITNDTRVFGHSTSIPRKDLWSADWIHRAKTILDSGRLPLWLFIGTAGRIITLVFRSKVDVDSRYVRLQNLGGGRFDLGISGELMALLRQPLVDRNDGSLPFRLNVRNE
jgi:hypothetical protein